MRGKYYNCVCRGSRLENPIPPTLTLCEECRLPFADRPIMHVSCTVCCSIWGGFHKDLYEGERLRRRTGVAGRVPRWPRCALESVVPMWAQVWLAPSCCVTACPMQSHQPVCPGKEPRPSPLLPSWPQMYKVWWLHSCKLCVIKYALIVVLIKIIQIPPVIVVVSNSVWSEWCVPQSPKTKVLRFHGVCKKIN